ncbi:unnamed protein product, partial [Mesorhabditis belari]|uniref:Uncharacterized protein n=1 Tax=Mesorhabditis belari TaxID=2138241 RepID=A0AAF3EFW7_9BILA
MEVLLRPIGNMTVDLLQKLGPTQSSLSKIPAVPATTKIPEVITRNSSLHNATDSFQDWEDVIQQGHRMEGVIGKKLEQIPNDFVNYEN